MSHPFRHYCFHLAEKLGKSLEEILSMESDVLSEWMAYHITCDEDWVKKYNEEKELEHQKQMSGEEKKSLFKQLLGG